MMTRDMDWKFAAGFGWKVGVVIGGALGFQEGFLSATIKPGSSADVPLTRVAQLVQVYFTPIFAEMLLWGLLGLLGALVLHVTLGRRFRAFGTMDGFIPVFSGLMAGVGNAVFIFFLLNSSFSLMMFLEPTKLLFNLRLVFSGVLTGMAVGFIVRAVRTRPRGHRFKALLVAFSIWALGLTPLALWVNRVYLKFSFSLFFLAVSVLFLLVLAGGTWLFAAWLSPRYLRGVGRYPLVRHLASLVVLLLLLPVFLPNYFGSARGAEDPVSAVDGAALDRNVILISVDTLRADRISSSGSDKCLTPNIDRLAEEGVLFSRAQAQSSWTLSSICSMLTSMYPTAHGVLAMLDQMDETRETVAEKVAAGGYRTGAVVSNGWLLEPFGVDQGFAFYDHMKHRYRSPYWTNHLWYRAMGPLRRRVNPEELEQEEGGDCARNLKYALEFIEANQDENFFFWLHVIDPHEPYTARDRWIAGAGKDYRGDQIPKADSGPVVNFRAGRVLNQDDRRHIEDLYNREVEYTDMILGRLLDRVYQLGLTRNTMIIFTSDHGEEFWEHGSVSHGHTFFTEQVQVPLLIRPADEEALERNRRIEAQVSLVDIPPTILEYLGLSRLDHAEGRSLLPMMRGEEEPADRPAFYEAMAYFGEKKAVSDGRYKYILSEVDGREELYDLQEDPAEQRNLVFDRPELKLELKGLLMDHLMAQRELASMLGTSDEKTEIGADTVEHLRALGYLN